MAAKVGNKLWVPKISNKVPSSGILMIGIDNYGDQENKNMNILSFCSNSDRECSQFYSNFITHQKNQVDKTHMNEIVFQCLTEYYRCNGQAPSDIILIKNGSTKYENATIISAEVN